MRISDSRQRDVEQCPRAEAHRCGRRRCERVGQYGRTFRDIPETFGGDPRNLTGKEVREYGDHHRHDRVIRHQAAHRAVRTSS